MHVDVFPMPLILLSLLCTIHTLFSTWILPLQLPYFLIQTLTFALCNALSDMGFMMTYLHFAKFATWWCEFPFLCSSCWYLDLAHVCPISRHWVSELQVRYAHIALHDFQFHILFMQLRSYLVAFCPWSLLCWLCVLHFHSTCNICSSFLMHLLYFRHVRSLCADCILTDLISL